MKMSTQTNKKIFELYVKGIKTPLKVEATKVGSNGEWKALCPNHKDEIPSLSINEEKKVYKCFGCNFQGSLWRTGSKEIETIYSYENAEGKMIFQIVRFQGKSFRPRRLNGDGKWIWNTEEIELVPYNLPEVSVNDIVWIVEGEKDVETLREMGLTGTTNPFGTAVGWKNSYNKYFKDKNIIVLPDNDEPGLKLGKHIALNLTGITKSVKVVNLPDLKEKGDISDWYFYGWGGHTKEELIELADNTPEYQLSIEELKNVNIMTVPASAGNQLFMEVTEQEETQFPKDTIQGIAKFFADSYSSCLESPWSFWAFSFLTCLGLYLSGKVSLDSAIQPQTRLFTILLGRSNIERKSEAIKRAIYFFNDVMPNAFELSWGFGSAEGLADFLSLHPKTLLAYDELAHLVNKGQITGSTLLPAIGSLHEDNRINIKTKHSDIKIENAHIAILGASTIDTFQRMWEGESKDIGFINRLWLIPDKAQSFIPFPQPIGYEVTETLRRELFEIQQFISNLKPIGFTPEGYEVWKDWYIHRSQDIFTDRLEGYGLRLMLLFCVNEMSNVITEDIAKRVVRLLQWQREIRELYNPIDAIGKIAEMEEKIRRWTVRPIGKRELKQRTNANRFGIWYFNQAINNLLGEDEIGLKGGMYYRR